MVYYKNINLYYKNDNNYHDLKKRTFEYFFK